MDNSFSAAHYVEQLRQGLWSTQTFGPVAVLVGAGFSRNAEITDPSGRPLVDFVGLARLMWHELNPGGGNAPVLDPIEIATEYEALFGRHKLDEFLRRSLPDAGYHPARIHRLLLSLPWADVFTTNWDTLLERAALAVVDRKYSIVASRDTIVGSWRPRIVKLHGSFPNQPPFIVTREDYRGYPRTHALFVNTVQQAVMECSLCLLGFSGSDPNFLAWSGWVHDNLGDSAPPIYLIGVLDLTERQRTALERRRVTPIDLAEVFPREQWPEPAIRHKLANEWFLLCLADGNPDPTSWPSLSRREASEKWTPDPNSNFPERLDPWSKRLKLMSLGDILECYPGWLACPLEQRTILEHTIRRRVREFSVSEATEQDWRMILRLWEILLYVLPWPWLEKLQEAVSSWDMSNSEARYGLAIGCLRQLRYSRRLDLHAALAKSLGSLVPPTAVCQALLCREIATASLEALDFEKVELAIAQWPQLPTAFRLELARTGILAELHRTSEALEKAQEVLQSIRASVAVGSQGSLEVPAIEGAAITLIDLLDSPERIPWRSRYDRYKELSNWDCLPKDYFEAAERQLRRALVPRPSIVPSFDVDSYTIHGYFEEGRTIADAAASLRLFEAFSIPFRCSRGLVKATFHSDLALLAARHISCDSPTVSASVIVRTGEQDGIDTTFDQLAVARIREEDVRSIYSMTRMFIEYGCSMCEQRNSMMEWEAQLAAAFELQSRVFGRLSPVEVEDAVRVAIALAQRDVFYDGIALPRSVYQSLLRAFEMLGTGVSSDVVNQLLRLPIPARDRRATGTQVWKEPLAGVRLRVGADSTSQKTWNRAICELLLTARDAEPTEAWPAIARLIFMHRWENLAPGHCEELGRILWGYDLGTLISNLSCISFYPTVLFQMTGLPKDVKALILEELFRREFPSSDGGLGGERSAAERAAESHFRSLIAILSGGCTIDAAFVTLTLKRATAWIQSHQSRVGHEDQRRLRGAVDDAALVALVELLAEFVVPAIEIGRTSDIATLSAFLDAVARDQVPTLQLQYHLQRLGLIARTEAAERLVRGLRADDNEGVVSAAHGSLVWLKYEDVPTEVFETLLGALTQTKSRPIHRLLAHVANSVSVSKDSWRQELVARLVFALRTLLWETDVEKCENDSLYVEPGWMPYARTAATRLAGTIWRQFPERRAELMPWEQAAKTDPVVAARTAWKDATEDAS